jgi:hypothetical protein
MSRHSIDRAGVDINALAQQLGADSAEPTPHQDGDDTSVPYLRFLDDTGAEVDLDDATVQQAIADYIPPVQPNPDAELAAAITAVDTSKIGDAATKAALNALKAALVGSGKPSAVAGRPTGR